MRVMGDENEGALTQHSSNTDIRPIINAGSDATAEFKSRRWKELQGSLHSEPVPALQMALAEFAVTGSG